MTARTVGELVDLLAKLPREAALIAQCGLNWRPTGVRVREGVVVQGELLRVRKKGTLPSAVAVIPGYSNQ